eukprot:TRINITY_DN1214_c0_g1_i1.p1 TRINITY_DN1214_c0_g1~~TRINITY_DN1214_c0_g1_i1.p1  ORF type:complete len:302 (+),score=106.18 TRINITY_DN1214_c0_g1_i1:72-977(+)
MSSFSSSMSMAKRTPKRSRATAVVLACGGIALAATLTVRNAFVLTGARSSSAGSSRVARQAGAVLFDLKNPVKTVSDTVGEFYEKYPQPPVLPMYRPYLVDMMSQTHLTTVDSRFKYDAIFASGLWDSFSSMMKNYDNLVGEGNTAKIWDAMVTSLNMDPAKVKSDAESIMEYAKSTKPADLMTHMEGTTEAPEAKAAEAFKSIQGSLYSNGFSVGLFRMMDLAGVEVTKPNVEEWAKILKLDSTKVMSDLETWKQNQQKLIAAEEMLREMQIREKKKLAQKLEEKAKALAAKAAAAKAEA